MADHYVKLEIDGRFVDVPDYDVADALARCDRATRYSVHQGEVAKRRLLVAAMARAQLEAGEMVIVVTDQFRREIRAAEETVPPTFHDMHLLGFEISGRMASEPDRANAWVRARSGREPVEWNDTDVDSFSEAVLKVAVRPRRDFDLSRGYAPVRISPTVNALYAWLREGAQP